MLSVCDLKCLTINKQCGELSKDNDDGDVGQKCKLQRAQGKKAKQANKKQRRYLNCANCCRLRVPRPQASTLIQMLEACRRVALVVFHPLSARATATVSATAVYFKL